MEHGTAPGVDTTGPGHGNLLVLLAACRGLGACHQSLRFKEIRVRPPQTGAQMRHHLRVRGSRLEPPPGRTRRGVLVRVGFRARLHGSDTEISLHASGHHAGHPAPTSRSWAPGRGSNVGRVCVAVTCLSPSGVRFASWIFSFDCWPGLPAAHRASRSVHPRRLVSRLCARQPASILAIGRSSDWQPPRKRN